MKKLIVIMVLGLCATAGYAKTNTLGDPHRGVYGSEHYNTQGRGYTKERRGEYRGDEHRRETYYRQPEYRVVYPEPRYRYYEPRHYDRSHSHYDACCW